MFRIPNQKLNRKTTSIGEKYFTRTHVQISGKQIDGFTLEERNQILEIAEWCQITPAEVLHRAALLLKVKPPMPKIDLEAMRVINEISKNFNLLLKQIEANHTIDTNIVDVYFRILAGLKLVIMEKQ